MFKYYWYIHADRAITVGYDSGRYATKLAFMSGGRAYVHRGRKTGDKSIWTFLHEKGSVNSVLSVEKYVKKYKTARWKRGTMIDKIVDGARRATLWNFCGYFYGMKNAGWKETEEEFIMENVTKIERDGAEKGWNNFQWNGDYFHQSFLSPPHNTRLIFPPVLRKNIYKLARSIFSPKIVRNKWKINDPIMR